MGNKRIEFSKLQRFKKGIVFIMFFYKSMTYAIKNGNKVYKFIKGTIMLHAINFLALFHKSIRFSSKKNYIFGILS